MATSRAERPATGAVPRRPPPPWDDLGRRQIAELTVPGVAIGLLAGLIAGGLAAAGGLAPDVAVVAGLSLAVPMALAGAGYEILLARGRFPLSALAPVAMFWVVAFPLVRIFHAAVTDLYAGDQVAVPHGWLDFIVYQMLLSVGFAIGYWWLHENFAPRWWYHLRNRNPVADHFIRTQLQYAAAAEEAKQRKQAQRKRSR